MSHQKHQSQAHIQVLQCLEIVLKRLFHQFSKLFIPCNCYDCILLQIEKEENQKENNIIINNEPK
jgi:hypothetical protein